MKLFGYEVRKAEPARKSSGAQIRPNSPQGQMTSYFQDYVLRKVSGEFYEVLREGIPIIDSAIRRLISLNGTIKIIGDNAALVDELEDFCRSVPVNDTQKGIHAFLENASNETFEQGFSISEFVPTSDMKDIAGIRVADSKQIVYRKNADQVAEPWYRYAGVTPQRVWGRPESIIQNILTAAYGQSVFISGMYETKLTPSNLLYFSINNENSDPYGVSIMRSMEFVSKILITMQNSIQNVWERFGDPSYKVLYKASKAGAGTNLDTRREQIKSDFSEALSAKRAGKSADFVYAVDKDSDIEIKIIGSEKQELTMDVPARHVLEQIVSKTNLPAWMLGLYWSTTERMATLEVESALQDAKIRQLAMIPEFIRLFSTFLSVRKRKWSRVTVDPAKPGDWGFYFETPNLRDVLAMANARFLNAQADLMERGGGAAASTTSVTVGQATFEINRVKTLTPNPLPRGEGGRRSGEGATCGCGKHSKGEMAAVKELSRPTPWPELDAVENKYENELKYDWEEFRKKIFLILGLKDVPVEEPKAPKAAFSFSDEQSRQIMEEMKGHIGAYAINDPDSPVRWYYGQSYSLGLIQAAQLVGEARPALDIIKNQEIYDALCRTGFQLLKDDITSAIVDRIIPEMQTQMLAGSNPRHVAAVLERLFAGQNSDWERLARSEMSMAAEKAKLDEWKEWNIEKVEFTPAPDACPICFSVAGEYDIGSCPVPVDDTHPRCRCSTKPVTA
jgi:hypothetical protein